MCEIEAIEMTAVSTDEMQQIEGGLSIVVCPGSMLALSGREVFPGLNAFLAQTKRIAAAGRTQ